ncbi:GntR family transcriptional regulator [Nocardia sp. NPDC050412]|uniref:GntR family transcriptional regulator n=1 Tax=Nocardia sp. NPDC050412 TaxID=3364320 RepID=UPI00379C5DC4
MMHHSVGHWILDLLDSHELATAQGVVNMDSIHRRVADKVCDRLRERIVGGELAPGDRIDPTEVAESLGVSRTPVREALLQLEAQGLIERLPYRGVVVTGIDLAEAEDIAALRIHLETFATRIAVPRLRPENLDRMREANAELTRAMAGPTAAQTSFGRFNCAFHQALYEAGGSKTLSRMTSDLSSQAERIRMHFDLRRGNAVAEHERILGACAAGEVEEAMAATRDHLLAVHLRVMPDGYRISPGSALEVALLETGWEPTVSA